MSLVDVANGIEMHGVVKSVQRGLIDRINAGEGELVPENNRYCLDITISTVNSKKCIVLVNHSLSLHVTYRYTPNARLVSDNVLRIYESELNTAVRGYHSFYNVNWQVIEFY